MHLQVIKELYNIFVGEICPPQGQLVRYPLLPSFRPLNLDTQMAWSGQFVVSKRRILANDYHRYDALAQLLEAPSGHWIHDVRSLSSLPRTADVRADVGTERIGRTG